MSKQDQLVFDKNKVDNALQDTLKLMNQNKMTIRELIVFYGNLGYIIGASISGFKGKGPDLEVLKKSYYSNPTVDVGFMLQGLVITSWEQSFLENPKISNLVNQVKENKIPSKNDKTE